MDRELCPRCGVLREMRAAESRRRVADEEGESREVLTRSYHCAVCQAFVRSEEVEGSVSGGD